MASRLSDFLWGGPPDDRLLELASRNQLGDSATMAAEVGRMLRDGRARRFSERFAREWLRLDKFGLVAINPEFYRNYDEDLGKDMVAETIATFQEIFHGDRDARELISSDTVYCAELSNPRRPASSGRDSNHDSDGAESNPIYRDVWILERLLNDPPPPPPSVVPALEKSSARV